MAIIKSDHAQRWPGGCVVWRFHQGLSEDERRVFRNAMTHWANRANVRFVPRTTQSSFLTFKSDGDIDSVNRSTAVGMAGGEQFVLLEPITAADGRGRSARHEIGHALGFHHEHVRCDRDTFVTVSPNIKVERWGDFAKLCGSDWTAVGDYDFRSVMHYNASPGATTDDTDALTGADAANQALLDDRDSRRQVSDGDIAGVGALHGGTAHVYQLTGDGQIEKTVRQYEWSAGWTTATPFLMDVRNFLFLIKRSSGRMHVHPIGFNGAIGDDLDNRDWSSGWSTAIKYAVGPVNYFLLYKEGDGSVHLHNIDVSGRIGPRVDDVSIEPGWTTIRPYAMGLDNFLVFINATTGAMRVRRIKWDGKIGESIQASTWTTGWTSVAPYAAGGRHYLFRLKSRNGSVSIRRIDGDGTIGPETDDADLDAGITTALPYEAVGNKYVLTVSAGSGTLEIRKLPGNGTLGSLTDHREFGPGWTTGAIYGVGAGTYLLLIKEGS